MTIPANIVSTLFAKAGAVIHTYANSITAATTSANLTTGNSGTGGSITKMSEFVAVATWYDSAVGGGTCYAAVVTTTATGSSISTSIGTPLAVAAGVASPRIIKLSSTTLLCVYATGSAQGVVLTLSGTTLTKGTITSLDPTAVLGTPFGSMSATAVSPTQAVVTWGCNGGFNNYAIRLVNISGTTITPSGFVALGSGEILSSSQMWIATTSANTVGCLYTYGSNNQVLRALTVTVNATTLTAGTPSILLASNMPYCKGFTVLPKGVGLLTGITATGAVYAATLSLSSTIGIISSATSTATAVGNLNGYTTGTNSCDGLTNTIADRAAFVAIGTTNTNLVAMGIGINSNNSLTFGTATTIYSGDITNAGHWVCGTSDTTASVIRFRNSNVGGAPTTVTSFVLN